MKKLKPLTENAGFSIDTDILKDYLKSLGATLVGIGDVREGLACEFRHLPIAISIAIAHPPIKSSLISEGITSAYCNQFPVVDARLEKIQKKSRLYLRSMGWKAFGIPPDTDKQDPRFAACLYRLFPHKTAATCAGLGWIGKNGLLVTEEYGARLSWATVLTNAPLKVSEKPYTRSECGDCERCKRVCPAGAISGTAWARESSHGPLIDVEKCAGQLAKHNQILGKYLCGHCIVACPIGKKAKLNLC